MPDVKASSFPVNVPGALSGVSSRNCGEYGSTVVFTNLRFAEEQKRKREGATQYVVPNASAGALSLGPLVTSVVTGGRGQDLNDDGFVGLNVLDKYHIVMDYSHERTYFQKYPAVQ